MIVKELLTFIHASDIHYIIFSIVFFFPYSVFSSLYRFSDCCIAVDFYFYFSDFYTIHTFWMVSIVFLADIHFLIRKTINIAGEIDFLGFTDSPPPLPQSTPLRGLLPLGDKVTVYLG